MRCCATWRPVLQRTLSTVQNEEVDTFSSEPLLNFIVVEKNIINKRILFMFTFCFLFFFIGMSEANAAELAFNAVVLVCTFAFLNVNIVCVGLFT